MSKYKKRIEEWLESQSDDKLEHLIQEYLKSMRPGGRIEQFYLIGGFKNTYVRRDFDMFVLGRIIDESIDFQSSES